VKQRVRLLLEEPLAVEALGEPLRKAPRSPAVKVLDRPLRQVLAYAMPVERELAADMQSVEAPLQQGQARVQGRRIIRTAIDAAFRPLQPAGADVVDGEIGPISPGRRDPRRSAASPSRRHTTIIETIRKIGQVWIRCRHRSQATITRTISNWRGRPSLRDDRLDRHQWLAGTDTRAGARTARGAMSIPDHARANFRRCSGRRSDHFRRVLCDAECRRRQGRAR
jgi:hypothetical protein